jgi:hypothetical protein
LTSDGLTVNAGASGNFGAVISSATQYSSDALRLQRNGVAAQGMNITAGGETVVFDSQNTGSGGLHSIFEFKSTDETTTKNVAKFNGKTNDISFYEDTGTTPKFFWDASAESLGIGTSSPTSKLHVKGRTIAVDGAAASDSPRLNLDLDGTNKASVLLNRVTEDLQLTVVGSNDMTFTTNSAERMRIDSSGNVGIGVTSPASGFLGRPALDVNGPVLARYSLLAHQTDAGVLEYSTDETRIRSYGNTAGSGKIIFKTGGGGGSADTERMRISSAGNVGIGTSSPAKQLHIESSTGGTLRLSSSDASVGAGESLGQIDWYSNDFSGSGSGVRAFVNVVENDGGLGRAYDMTFGTGQVATATERMRIDSSGKLSLTASDQGIQIGPDIAAYTIKRDSSGLLNFRATQQNFNGYIFDTVDGERMRIDSSGNVLIHRTSPAASAKGISFAVDANGTVMDCGTTYSGFDQMRFWHNGNRVGTIQVTASSTSYVTSSDYRLKTDAQPMTGASARVQALKPVNFEWIADGTRVDGFLAHEAQTVVPEAVTGTKDAMRDEEYEVTPAVLDDDGNVVTEAVMGTRSVPDYQGIDQSKLVPLLTAALQEALTKIDALETRITALEG